MLSDQTPEVRHEVRRKTTVADVDAGQQLITVLWKGTRVLQQLAASPDAFVWLRLCQAQLHGLVPTGRDEPLWWTLRKPLRALSYDAARLMFTRAAAGLGANWSLHDLRHTAAYRMARDPQVSLCDVQWVMGHAHLSTTQRCKWSRPEPGQDLADHPDSIDARGRPVARLARVIEYDVPDRVGHGSGELIVLLTTITDPTHARADELAVAYHERWEQETRKPRRGPGRPQDEARI